MEFKRLDDRGNDGRGYRLAYYRMRTYGKYYDTYRKSRRRLFAFLSLFQYGLYLQEEYWNHQVGHLTARVCCILLNSSPPIFFEQRCIANKCNIKVYHMINSLSEKNYTIYERGRMLYPQQRTKLIPQPICKFPKM